ncbi:MAG: hypothetical protein AMJ76_03530 [Dehalococcoidia bacterium SM23_28_1]|nr:MAG: hypothetical protein AMJ76_03530 [Dehalococcoidia bacterium SM23_28_1]
MPKTGANVAIRAVAGLLALYALTMVILATVTIVSVLATGEAWFPYPREFMLTLVGLVALQGAVWMGTFIGRLFYKGGSL